MSRPFRRRGDMEGTNPFATMRYSNRIRALAAKDGVDTSSRAALDAWYEPRKEKLWVRGQA